MAFRPAKRISMPNEKTTSGSSRSRSPNQDATQREEQLQNEPDALDPAMLAQMRPEPHQQRRPHQVQRAEQAALEIGDRPGRNPDHQHERESDQTQRKKGDPGATLSRGK